MAQRYMVNHCSLARVENGFIIHLATSGWTITLVAKELDEALDLLGQVEFQTPPARNQDEVSGGAAIAPPRPW